MPGAEERNENCHSQGVVAAAPMVCVAPAPAAADGVPAAFAPAAAPGKTTNK